MSKIFEPTWVEEIKKRYKNRPGFQQSCMYKIAVLPEKEESRLTIEKLVCDLGVDSQKIIPRLRNPDSFLSTYNELRVGGLIKSNGHRLEYEKLISGKTPDWFVTPAESEKEFIVEVVTVMPSKEYQAEKQAWEELQWRIHNIEHYYNLMIRTRQPKALIGKDIKRIVRSIEEWFSTFDLKNPPDKDILFYNDQGLEITFKLSSRKTKHKCAIKTYGQVFTLWVDKGPLRNAIGKKLTKYSQAKEAHLPLIIAVFLTSESCININATIDVLFGNEQISVETGQVSRNRNGLVLPKIQQGQVFLKNTRLSAILHIEETIPPTIKMVHNPYAQDPISPTVFPGIDH